MRRALAVKVITRTKREGAIVPAALATIDGT